MNVRQRPKWVVKTSSFKPHNNVGVNSSILQMVQQAQRTQ